MFFFCEAVALEARGQVQSSQKNDLLITQKAIVTNLQITTEV